MEITLIDVFKIGMKNFKNFCQIFFSQCAGVLWYTQNSQNKNRGFLRTFCLMQLSVISKILTNKTRIGIGLMDEN